MSLEEALAEFQRVFGAIVQGHTGVGAEDLAKALDGMAAYLEPEEFAALRVLGELLTAYQHRDVATLMGLPARLAELRARLPEGSLVHEELDAIGKLADYMAQHVTRKRGARFLPPPEVGASAPIELAARLLTARETVDPKVINKLRRDAIREKLSPIERAFLLAQIGLLSSAQDNPAQDWLAIRDFRMAVRFAAEGDPQRPHYLLMLADALLNRAWATSQAPRGVARLVTRMSLRPMSGALRDAAEGIALLEEARELAGWPGQPHWALICLRLGLGYRLAGRNDEARAVGVEGLRGHMWQVLMQAHTAAAAAVVTWAATDALEVAGWHSDDGDAEGAAAALEAGRALILNATTETRDVPRQLAEAGFDDLAGQWAALPEGLEAKPAALRRAVFERLVEPRRLLDPPTGEEVRAALTAVGADALVYLVPEDEQVGHAVIVPAQGPATILELPGLTDPPDKATASPADREPEPQPQPKPQPLGIRELGPAETPDDADWAWTAAIGPLLDGPFAGREPRLVLIPMGELGRVAWHAARSADGWAIERATISYAPSARMLCRAASAEPKTSGPALIVGDPDTGDAAPDLPGARVEAQTIHERFFPHARYVGRPAEGADGRGSAAEVEEWLAGDDAAAGGVLHLACHGGVRDDQAYLLLDGGEQLSADRLATATRNGRRPGLVVLAACRTAVSGRGWDEAFSLAATFLAAGAGAVVAAQWSLPDRAVSELMLLFHEHIAAGERPVDALRKAQLASLHRPVADWAGLIHFGR
ncbi:CHAT domain-containing protein [Paractinoplanes lichenicola]|uniref:CHAT domain-containing protein n=1 Tax=Paractinoplanes lichenicola TaxID=2802976 RepID=A0ABS1VM63_9ACTN|nr:CHAT domain-containing protein [Actinoplanes lichenicola]MBL7255740.1 CHAT domain-containing protein [Actinoplanes lichenicola]